MTFHSYYADYREICWIFCASIPRMLGGNQMPDSRYVVMPVTCTRCKQVQDVHVEYHPKAGQMIQETVVCKACHKPFEVMLPDKIVSGEFLPR
jgi:hypothetical protein